MAKKNARSGHSAKRSVSKKLKAKRAVAKPKIAKRAKAAPVKKAVVKIQKRISASGAEAPRRVKEIGKESVDEVMSRKRVNVSIPKPEDAKGAIDTLMANDRAIEYLKRNVSKKAVDVLGMLSAPKTDEFLAEELDMKINAIRRILNRMQGYGITNYYISKNTNGWLSFAWYINTSKLAPFLEYIDSMDTNRSIVNESSDDYFVCNACYKDNKIIYPFDAAFENNFKCDSCSKNLARMGRSEIQELLNEKSEVKETV
ncbi:MAG: hypothetical protein KGH60_01225 [Candidatus Micrarchaeota archaeon]|nr:hypothetical protein [Candidatus Micrarchaeota archaeon]